MDTDLSEEHAASIFKIQLYSTSTLKMKVACSSERGHAVG
jgi:hypothetical protein